MKLKNLNDTKLFISLYALASLSPFDISQSIMSFFVCYNAKKYQFQLANKVRSKIILFC